MRKTEIKRPNPTQCLYWQEPKQIQSGPLQDRFELLKTYVKSDHFWQYLLKCRECAQQYVMEFNETIDWVNSNDPQFTVYAPVSGEEEARHMLLVGPSTAIPSLHQDFPSDAEEPMVYWVAEE